VTRPIKFRIITALKLAVSVALIVFLVWKLLGGQDIGALLRHEKDWGLLAWAFLLVLAAVSTTIARWCLLVRAVGIPFPAHDAIRLGAMGYALNLVSLGSVGGDLFKAIAVARERPDRKTKAIASVVVDRCIGMYALFLLASVGVALAQPQASTAAMMWLFRMPWIGAGLGTVALLVVCLPGFTTGSFAEFLIGLPRVGGFFSQLFSAFQMYRSNWRIILTTILLGMGVQTLFAVAFWCLAHGLYGAGPDLATHLVIVPMSMTAGAVPLPFGALGAFDSVVSLLYANAPSSARLIEAQGLIIAFGYRVVTICLAILATLVWFWMGTSASRRHTLAPLGGAETECRYG
jgi:uncharacterized membrane protein YbhN (UPF0104 family)